MVCKNGAYGLLYQKNESGKKGLDMDGGSIMPSQFYGHYGRLGGSLGGGHVPPLCSRIDEEV